MPVEHLLHALACNTRAPQVQPTHIWHELRERCEAHIGKQRVATQRDFYHSVQSWWRAITVQVGVSDPIAHQAQPCALHGARQGLDRIPHFGVRPCKGGNATKRADQLRHCGSAESCVAHGQVGQVRKLRHSITEHAAYRPTEVVAVKPQRAHVQRRIGGAPQHVLPLVVCQFRGWQLERAGEDVRHVHDLEITQFIRSSEPMSLPVRYPGCVRRRLAGVA